MTVTKIKLLLRCGILLLASCKKEESSSIYNESAPTVFSVNNNYILKNNQPFAVKGMVYVPGYPGFLPWEIESSQNLPASLRANIYRDILDIKAMNANTIRFWGAPQYCYQALKEIGGLHFIQTIWIDSEAGDFQAPTFKESTKTYIRSVVDRVYSVYPDKRPPLIAYVLGNELSRSSIIATDAAHPNLNYFKGNFIETDSNRTATEVFLAEMADYLRSYESENYQQQSLISYANEIRTFNLIEAPFLDFISHNAYSYAVPYYRPNTRSGSGSGTLFQGWLEEIKLKHLNKPLLITETGLSVSPNAGRVGPPNYGYGGNSAIDQGESLLQNLNDINTTGLPLAGLCIHEYLDAWWKFGYQDSFSQDPNDIEEWFGVAQIIDSNGVYNTEFRYSYFVLQKAWQ